MTAIKPLSNNVLIKPLSEEGERTQSGIIIPETAGKERPDQGIVEEVGPGKKDENGKIVAMSVKKGDKVLFSKYGPDEVKISGQKYYIISEDNILAVIEE